MLGQMAMMIQQLITLLLLSAAIVAFSPWFLVLLVAAVIPAFMGETKFAMLAYSHPLPLYPGTPRTRLSAHAGRQQS